MKKEAFYFDLPPELIAQEPLPNRTDSRLLYYSRAEDKCEHHVFSTLVDLLEPGDLLVMNDSRVIPARLYGVKETGGKVELLVERIIAKDTFLAHIRASKALKVGGVIHLDAGWHIQILRRDGALYNCQITGDVEEMLQAIGHVPLPLYIRRIDAAQDVERYQTVYARSNGSVAAPTAGLHMDETLLTALVRRGVNLAYTTLHVGAGTFQPVRCENITDHHMHYERFTVTDELVGAICAAKSAKKRVIAVGTTALRSLESAAIDGQLRACSGETNIFIYPGYKFKVCDGLITNFHVPESTLFMLVAAFIGYEEVFKLYRLAIAQRYRFYSYGDTSLLLPGNGER